MTATVIAELLGSLTAAWAIGFAAGFILTRTKEAINHVG